MKLPLAPQPIDQLLTKTDPAKLPHLFRSYPGSVEAQRYLHWDETRHREPPAGLSHDEWWLSIKLARMAQARRLPLLDKSNRPFSYVLTEEAQRSLHLIDRDAGGQILLDAPVAGDEARERYLVSNLIEEAITSSQLEGASTTRRVAEDMLRQGRKPRDLSERMIFNNYQAMRHIRNLLDQKMTPETVLELHRIVSLGTLENPSDAGRLRESDDVHVVDRGDGKTLHVPPSAATLSERLNTLCLFANGTETDTPYVHPVIRAILLHFMLGYDHPFADGNGRTARALFYWAMARHGYWLMEYLSISNILRRAPAQYVRAYLHTETDDGDTTYFILHQLGVIEQAVGALHTYLVRKGAEERATLNLLRTPALRERFNHRQIALLTHALKHDDALYTIESHRKSHAVTYATARSDLLRLSGTGLLEMAKEGKRLVFLVPSDLQGKVRTLR